MHQSEGGWATEERWGCARANELTLCGRSDGCGVAAERDRSGLRLFKRLTAVECVHRVPVVVATLRCWPLHGQPIRDRRRVAKCDIDFASAGHSLATDADQIELARRARNDEARGASVADGVVVIAGKRNSAARTVDDNIGVEARVITGGNRQAAVHWWHNAEPHIVGE